MDPEMVSAITQLRWAHIGHVWQSAAELPARRFNVADDYLRQNVNNLPALEKADGSRRRTTSNEHTGERHTTVLLVVVPDLKYRRTTHAVERIDFIRPAHPHSVYFVTP